MFLVLVKYVDDTAWGVESDPFKHLVDAVKAAKRLAESTPDTFAVVEVNRMYRRAISVTEVEVAP